MLNLLDCNVGSLVGYACSQTLTAREVISGESTKLYSIKTDLGWSIVGGGQAESVRSFCQRAVVRELHVPAITMNAIVRILKSDFKENKNDKKTSHENLQFLKIMEEGITKTENRQSEMPLPFKERPLLPNNCSIAMTCLEHLKWQFLKDSKYKEDYINVMNKVFTRGDAKEAPAPAKMMMEWSGIYLIMVSITQRNTRQESYLTAQYDSRELPWMIIY